MPEDKGQGQGSAKSVKPLYEFHRGSIRVSGKSQVFKTGLSAFHEWRNGTRPVEFVFLGGNAGHQAYKAAVVTRREIENTCKTQIAFIPMWSSVMTDSRDGRAEEQKDLSIWRIVELNQAEKPSSKRRNGHKKQDSARNGHSEAPKPVCTEKPQEKVLTEVENPPTL